MIIILGFDNTGKTTLAEQLSSTLGLPIVNSVGVQTQADQTAWMNHELIWNSDSIFERFTLFEEMVYGKVLRSKSNYSFDSPLTRVLKNMDPIIIYARPSKESILDFGDRPQMPGVIEKAEKLLSEWDELIFKLLMDEWKVIPYNWQSPLDYGRLVEQIQAEQLYQQIKTLRGKR